MMDKTNSQETRLTDISKTRRRLGNTRTLIEPHPSLKCTKSLKAPHFDKKCSHRHQEAARNLISTETSEIPKFEATLTKEFKDGNWPWARIVNSFSSLAPSLYVSHMKVADSFSWMRFAVKLKDVVFIPRLSSWRLVFISRESMTIGSGNPSASQEIEWDDPSTIQVSAGSRVHFAGTARK